MTTCPARSAATPSIAGTTTARRARGPGGAGEGARGVPQPVGIHRGTGADDAPPAVRRPRAARASGPALPVEPGRPPARLGRGRPRPARRPSGATSTPTASALDGTVAATSIATAGIEAAAGAGSKSVAHGDSAGLHGHARALRVLSRWSAADPIRGGHPVTVARIGRVVLRRLSRPAIGEDGHGHRAQRRRRALLRDLR